ncbi:MAG: Sua5/YciO/YrdC/YwlC family protein, partial [Leptospiraceae bacterium]|nr:Sua5/YciO/YrdC/YwlC family protein [Leptospiraceae bacterium]
LHRALMEQLDTPLVSTSITTEAEFTTDPEDLERLYGNDVAAVVDGGIRAHEYSTILDCRPDPLILMREGIGPVDDLEFVRQE